MLWTTPKLVPAASARDARERRYGPPTYDAYLANRAAIFLQRSYQTISPRKLWPPGDALPSYGFTGRIKASQCANEGRVLCLWRDAGWGQLVASGRCDSKRFDDELVSACVEMVQHWNPEPGPGWVCGTPSLIRVDLVPDFAARLADALGLPFSPCIRKERANSPQKKMQNGFQQARNLDGVFGIDQSKVLEGPCLLVDDLVDSRWTLTVVAALLRRSGCESVFPLALAQNRSGLG